MDATHETPAPDFVSHWGLRFDPFAPDAEVPFFPSEGFTAALEQLEHYCRFGNLLLVVTGQSGAGKTLLRKEFNRSLTDTGAEVCALLAHPLHTTGQVLHQVAQAFGLGDALIAQPTDELEAFCQHLAAAPTGSLRVLIIDDADTLDASVVSALVELNHRLCELPESPLKIVLFGEPHLSAMLAQSGVSSGRGEDVHIISLGGLQEHETAAYLQHRLAAAGFDRDVPLSAGQLESLHRTGHGLPAQINRHAGNFLTELLDIATAIEEEPVTMTPALRRSLMVAAGIVVVGFALLQLPKLFQSDEPPHAVGQIATVTAPATPTPEPVTPEVVTHPMPDTLSEPGEQGAVDAQPPVPAGSTLPVTTPSEAAPESSMPVSEPSVPTPEPALTETPPPAAPATVSEPEPRITETPVVTSKPVVESKPVRNHSKASDKPKLASKPTSSAKASVPALSQSLPRNEEALKKANPKHYTVQLVGLSEQSRINAFIREHKLSGDLHVYRALRDGKTLYVLVQGVYPSRAAAVAAIARLPALPDKPWAKSLAAVQKDMASR